MLYISFNFDEIMVMIKQKITIQDTEYLFVHIKLNISAFISKTISNIVCKLKKGKENRIQNLLRMNLSHNQNFQNQGLIQQIFTVFLLLNTYAHII